MSEEIDDILNGIEPEAVEETVETPQEAEPVKAEQPRGPDGKFAPKGEKEDAPPASSEDRVPVSAIQDERRKRQELEARLQEYEQKLQQLTQPPQQPIDMFENPEGWQGQFGQQVTETAVSQASLNARLDMSEMLVAQAHDDFEEVRPKILEFLEANPAVRSEVLSARHPWAKAYQMVKNNEQAKALGATDIESLRAAIRAELEAELKTQQPAVALPSSLAAAQGGTPAGAPVSPPSLAEILGR